MSHSGSATPAKLAFLLREAETVEQGLLDVGVNAKWLTGSASASFNFRRSERKSAVVVRFVQSYYTLAAEPPRSPSAMLAPEVKVEDCTRFMGAGNPPAFVSSVTYGRMLVFLFESRQEMSKLTAAVSASFQAAVASGQLNVGAENLQILNESTVQVLALGAPRAQLFNCLPATSRMLCKDTSPLGQTSPSSRPAFQSLTKPGI